MSVATDPAFPDPRVTPPPRPTQPPYTPPPYHPTPIPEVTLSRCRRSAGIYTSPPLPIPLVSHEPGATETEPPTLSPEERANVAPSVGATQTAALSRQLGSVRSVRACRSAPLSPLSALTTDDSSRTMGRI